MIGKATLAAATLFVAAMAGTAQAQAVEFERYCVGARPPVHLFLVDQTEPFDTVDRRRLEAGINTLFNELRPGTQLDIYPLTNRPGSLRPLVQMCVPGCPDELPDDKTNWEFSCARITIQRAKQAFRNRFLEAVRLLSGNSESADGTEIIRSIEQLGYEYPPGQVTHLTIFSDMLEFSSLNRRINAFTEKDAANLLRKSEKIIHSGGALAGANVTAFGFGKRLGQQSLIDEKIQAGIEKGQSDEAAQNWAEAEALLPNEPRDAVRGFWGAFFTDLVGAQRFRLTQNY